MLIDWETVLNTIVVSLAASASVAFLAKALTKHALAYNLETHKALLQTNSSKEVEQLKAALQKAAIEHQVQFTRLHERRGQVIADVYSRLEAVHSCSRRWAAAGSIAERPELREQAGTAILELETFFHSHAIWLDKDTSDAISSILDDFRGVLLDISLTADGSIPSENLSGTLFRSLNLKIPTARSLLESRFRAILGPSSSAVPGAGVVPSDNSR